MSYPLVQSPMYFLRSQMRCSIKAQKSRVLGWPSLTLALPKGHDKTNQAHTQTESRQKDGRRRQPWDWDWADRIGMGTLHTRMWRRWTTWGLVKRLNGETWSGQKWERRDKLEWKQSRQQSDLWESDDTVLGQRSILTLKPCEWESSQIAR